MVLKEFCVVLLVILVLNECSYSKCHSKELSPEYKQFLDELTPNFQENLIRAFRNEAVRNQRRRPEKFIHKMDNILLSVDNTKIELGELKFPWIPDFRVINMAVDLGMLCLDVSFKLGDLRVEGQYEANNLTLQKLLPVSNNGKIVISFKDVTLQGRIGLVIKGDSFLPENYDIDYGYVETEVSVNYYVTSENQIENKITNSNGEKTLGDLVWIQLNDILTNLLHKQLGEVVVEYSVTETLADEDAEIREMAKEHSSKANKLFDSLLCSAKDYLVAKNYRGVASPAFDVIYRGKLSGVQQGRLETEEGYIQDLSTLSRQQDLSLYETRHKLVVYGSLCLKDFKHGYEKFTSKFETTQISGSIRTSVYMNKIFIKLSLEKGQDQQCKAKLERVQIRTINDIDVDASGLASLSWLAPKLRSWVIGNLRCNALPVLERYIVEGFNYAIENTNCTALLTS